MTNLERIQNMNAEEMANILEDCKNHCVYWRSTFECIGKNSCRDGILNWLESEVDDRVKTLPVLWW